MAKKESASSINPCGRRKEHESSKKRANKKEKTNEMPPALGVEIK